MRIAESAFLHLPRPPRLTLDRSVCSTSASAGANVRRGGENGSQGSEGAPRLRILQYPRTRVNLQSTTSLLRTSGVLGDSDRDCMQLLWPGRLAQLMLRAVQHSERLVRSTGAVGARWRSIACDRHYADGATFCFQIGKPVTVHATGSIYQDRERLDRAA